MSKRTSKHGKGKVTQNRPMYPHPRDPSLLNGADLGVTEEMGLALQGLQMSQGYYGEQ